MRIVTMTRDMRPFQAGHDAAIPDDELAARLIAEGAAVPSPRDPAPPAAEPVPKPLNRYLTRGKRQ